MLIAKAVRKLLGMKQQSVNYEIQPTLTKRVSLGAKKVVHLAATCGFIVFGSRRTFSLEGHRFRYFYHPYNNTYRAERCVEIPVIRYLLSQSSTASVLEVGNVLQHYTPCHHDVVDKFEKGDSVINCDILDFEPGKRYSTIVSISTLEHIGFDENVKDEGKPLITIERLKSWLIKGGRLIVSAPAGYNPAIDRGIRENQFGFQRYLALRRISFATWVETDVDTALRAQWSKPYPYANAVFFGIYEAC